jgi:hypothetical protein|tara:strand:+ start:69 stop:746 length:678 start_codon:yes stop_codon:yes gene_type:complete
LLRKSKNFVIRSILERAFPALDDCKIVYNSFVERENSYLHSTGWLESKKRGYPCKKDGSELPWMNYPVIDFLEKRLKCHFTLFEYGCGYSTLFFSKLVNQVTTVEYDREWYDLFIQKIPENVKLVYCPKDYNGKYCRIIGQNSQKYDVVIIDGRDRVNCMKQSIDHLTKDGVIILDDSSRENYIKGIKHLKDKNFYILEFEGLKPTGYEIDKTTILYRRANCLGI